MSAHAAGWRRWWSPFASDARRRAAGDRAGSRAGRRARPTAVLLERMLPWVARLTRGRHFRGGVAPDVCAEIAAAARAGGLFRSGPASLTPAGVWSAHGASPASKGASEAWPPVEEYRLTLPRAGGRLPRPAEAVVRHYRGRGRRPALVVLSHGTGACGLIERVFVGRLRAAGLDVAVPWRRAPGRRRRDGVMPIAWTDSVGTALVAVVELVHATAAVAAWARWRGYETVAVAGFGIGGVVAALAASTTPGIDACVTILAGGHPGWLWHPRHALARVLDRRALARDGVHDAAALASLFDPVAPVCLPPPAARVRRTVVGFRFDRLVRPRDVARLARHWDVSAVWLARAHVELPVAAAELVPLVVETVLGDGGRARRPAPAVRAEESGACAV